MIPGRLELTDSDRALVREIAREIVKEFIPAAIGAHVNACPWGESIKRVKWTAAGVCIGSGIAGGSVALAVARVVGG